MVAGFPSFTIGIEEEYLLVDAKSLDLVKAPEGLMTACVDELQGQVSPEFLQCQIEVGTKVCQTVGQARDDLKRLRACISKHARDYGLAPMAASCHPFAKWSEQLFTDKERYRTLEKDLGGVARRMLICGMHVHVGIEDDETRIDLLAQFPYFLPHLLALSTSSPFWQGRDTGLASYRLAVFDNLPRTGLPPRFTSFGEYQRSVQMIIDSGLIQDTSKIWWDLRLSSRFPTLESRICDVSPRMEDALTLAAVTQCLMRMLYRLRTHNQRWRIYDRFLVSENRWRAQRYGITDGLIDFGRGEVVSFADQMEELIDMLGEDAEALECKRELEGVRRIVDSGTSADRQRRVYANAMAKSDDSDAALRGVVAGLIEEFHQDL